MKVLCTFSGKYGDILWSLPTARQIAQDIAGGKVDFAMMPYYENLRPLIASQEYIDECFVIPDWIRTHSNHGDGPWEAPSYLDEVRGIVGDKFTQPELRPIVKAKIGDYQSLRWYEKIYHLTYKGHPGINAPSMPLVDFVAYQQGIELRQPIIPFLNVDKLSGDKQPEYLYVAYAFNEQYSEPKQNFLQALLAKFDVHVIFVDVSKLPWKYAAEIIAMYDLFIGCRSANWVIAMALGKQTVTYEPHPSRHASCHLGKVFGCHYGQEVAIPYLMPPAAAAEVAAGIIRKKMEEQGCSTAMMS